MEVVPSFTDCAPLLPGVPLARPLLSTLSVSHSSADLSGGLPETGTLHNKGLLFILGRNTDIS